MKNVVFWDIKPQFVPHRRHTTSLQSLAVFWDVTPCGSGKNPSFGGTYRLHHQGDKNRFEGDSQLPLSENVELKLLMT
jgi:hypothetical protein